MGCESFLSVPLTVQGYQQSARTFSGPQTAQKRCGALRTPGAVAFERMQERQPDWRTPKTNHCRLRSVMGWVTMLMLETPDWRSSSMTAAKAPKGTVSSAR